MKFKLTEITGKESLMKNFSNSEKELIAKSMNSNRLFSKQVRKPRKKYLQMEENLGEDKIGEEVATGLMMNSEELSRNSRGNTERVLRVKMIFE